MLLVTDFSLLEALALPTSVNLYARHYTWSSTELVTALRKIWANSTSSSHTSVQSELEAIGHSPWVSQVMYKQISKGIPTNTNIHRNYGFPRTSQTHTPVPDRDSADEQGESMPWPSDQFARPVGYTYPRARSVSGPPLPVVSNVERKGVYAKAASSTASYNSKPVVIYRPEWVNTSCTSGSESPTRNSLISASDNEFEDMVSATGT
ncbi:hypothetical protein LTR70_010366 [Exophiala xenobiotica]|uniref:Uncharacterized protein n=1 Tax=Lithohypha guttulata TaxID=1690604 RepID=A0ABR0JUB2_9EURO|nr:hypothetical protein LTR24_010327 [Lithohypha guttulata]KAK5309351.1 hypothetical protein LTR70_010366 [Exophiala xenobiotica]